MALNPDWVVPPGEVLRAELEARQMSQADLAARTGLSAKHVNQVIKAVVPLSADTAARLELALNVPSRLWNALEAAHRDHVTRKESTERLDRFFPWLARFPTTELIRRGVLPAGDRRRQVDVLLRFFGVADPDAYERVWSEPLAVGFRRAQAHAVDPYATGAWIRLGEIAAEELDVSKFDGEALRRLIPKLRRLTKLSDAKGFAKLRVELSTVGVAVVFVPELTGCRAHGATRWLAPDRAVLILTDRYRWADVFWFTVFHELAHVALHPRRRTFVDLGDSDDSDGHESEANDFAAEVLLPGVSNDDIAQLSGPPAAVTLAKRSEVDPGIVAGRYAHITGDWRSLSKLRHKFSLAADA